MDAMRIHLLFCLCPCLVGASLSAQTGFGKISGSVKDIHEKKLEGMSISLLKSMTFTPSPISLNTGNTHSQSGPAFEAPAQLAPANFTYRAASILAANSTIECAAMGFRAAPAQLGH